MHFATFLLQGRRRIGVVDRVAGTVAPLTLPPDGDRGVGALIGRELPPMEPAVALAQVRLQAPIPRPARNIFCVGKNYFDHAHEFARSGFDSSAASGAVPDAPSSSPKCPNA